MADRRKLQNEMDRCMKRVNEGVEVFEDLWMKWNQSVTSGQKEKFEADMKKEVKKLQRFRDQIKAWLSSSDIKDKTQLMEYRRLIEKQMETFKLVEHDTKVKTYSIEGLTKADKVFPEEKEKEEASNFLTTSIDKLKVQVDTLESAMENLQTVNKKKKLDKDRLDELTALYDQHKTYISCMETLLRMLNNETVNASTVKSIQVDMEYYISDNQQPDFMVNKDIFSEITLDDTLEVQCDPAPSSISPQSSSVSTQSLVPSQTSASSQPSQLLTSSSSAAQKENISVWQPDQSSPSVHSSNSSAVIALNEEPDFGSKKQVTPTILRNFPSYTSLAEVQVTPGKNFSGKKLEYHSAVRCERHGSTLVSTSTSSQSSQELIKPQVFKPQQLHFQDFKPQDADFRAVATSWQQNKQQYAVALATTNHPLVSEPKVQVIPCLAKAIASPTMDSLSPLIGNGPSSAFVAAVSSAVISYSQVSSVPPLLSTPLTSSSSTTSTVPSSLSSQRALTSNDSAYSSQLGSQLTTINSGMAELKVNPRQNSFKSMAERGVQNERQHSMWTDGITCSMNSVMPSGDHSLSSLAPSQLLQQQAALMKAGQRREDHSLTTGETVIPPVLGVAPLGPTSLTGEHRYQLAMIDATFRHLPHPSDSERLRRYLPRNCCPTPPYYTKEPLPKSDTMDFFEKLSTETLFFIFYYLEGTKAHYMAAKALKRQSWRFHTKLLMWFQRHTEPTKITEEYEEGSYVYFDYETWTQMRREGFTFEYRFLEDQDLK